ncbi:MAG TPA: penicillin acylase family protein, partial [Kofleriaceae bacterium]|nr:penicillin acylase family protein [Kofleriaceae bacterium]
ELIGRDGLSTDVQLRTLFTTRAGHRVESDLAAALDPETRALIASYVGGINAYLAQLRATGGALPPEYSQLPYALTPDDIADWSLEDTEALARLFQWQLSETLGQEAAFGQFASVYASGPLADLAKINAWIRAAAPLTEQAHTLATPGNPIARTQTASRVPAVGLAAWSQQLGSTAAAARDLRAALRPRGAPVGSNNWVVAGAMSASGAAMVANDPHLSLNYPPQFHLAVLTSANASDNLDVAGGAFPGVPGALVGRGANVGWAVTVVGYDVTDLYLEQFLPQASCPSAAPCVLFKGAPVSALPVPQTYKVRVGPGAAGLVDAASLSLPKPPPPVVLVIPHHGPVIQAPDAAGKAISVRWTGQEGNTQDLKAFLGLNMATDVDAAIVSLRDYATGAQNFVLADDRGHIAYDPHALVPVRNFADARLHGSNVIPPWFPLPGDGTAEWGDGVSNCASATATPVPGSCWIVDDLLPHGKDPAKGYFFTANADPTWPSVSDDNNPLAHPPYLSFAWDDSTGFRATRIDQLLSAAIAAHGKVSLADMEAIESDHVSRPGMAFAPYIAALPTDETSPAELVLGKQVFAAWANAGFDCPSGLLGTDPAMSAASADPTVQANSAGCFLFHVFLRRLVGNVFTDDLAVAGQDVDGGAAVKALLYMLTTPAAGSFCNDVDAKGQLVATHTCMEQVGIALTTAVALLQAHVGAEPNDWVWGRVHTLTPVSPLPFVTVGYEPGPYARPGGAFTVDVASPDLTSTGLEFSYTSGAQVRHISVMDAAQPVMKMQLPGPQRDTPSVFVGPDLLGGWLTNTYFDFAYGAQINSAATSTQTFAP